MIRIFKTSLSSSSDSPEGLTTELGQQTSPGRRGFGPKSSGHRSPGGGASIFSNKRLILPFLAFVAVLAAGLLFLLPGGLIQAQDSATIEYAEGSDDAVATFTATDPEGGMITWTLTGTDDSVFSITGGVLEFDSAPDFEAPGDANTDNTYNVTVNASDGVSDADTFEVTVEVTDVEEDGVVTWTTDADANGTDDDPTLLQFQPDAELEASVTDGDTTTANTLGNQIWQWYRSSSKTSRGTAIEEDANAAEYTVVGDDVGNYLRVEVSYNVGGGPQESAYLVSDYRVQAKRATNSEPEFDPATVTRKVNEGEEGMAVGAPVRATDDDGDVLNYRLTGDDSNRFEIDQKTGQITTSEDLDYEATSGDNQCSTANECEVMVTATDSTGAASTPAATVSITLENVDEKPEFTGGLEMVSVAENMTQVSDTAYAATDEDGNSVRLALMGDDGDLFRLSADPAGELHFRMAPDFENPMDANTDNVYEVTVRALDGTMHKDRMVTITVTAVDESPEIMEGDATIEYAKGGDNAVATFTATDPEGGMITWTLTGTDDSVFSITGGVLEFDSAPDFEAPGDANTDNTYNVTVNASDGVNDADTFEVTVEVTDVEEDGVVTWTTDADANGTDDDPTFCSSSPTQSWRPA